MAGLGCMLLAGCSLGPDYQRPATAAHQSPTYINAPAPASGAAQNLSRWWERMDDDWMSRNVDMLLRQNLQLKEAAARVAQAWSQVGVQKGGTWPSLSASATGSRQRTPIGDSSMGAAVPGLPAAPGAGQEYYEITQWQASVSARWQLDLFGKIRRGIEAAEAGWFATRADAEALLHTLIAELARLRVSLATLQRQIEIARATVESRQLTLTFVDQRYRRGTRNTSAVDIYLARENLAAAESELTGLNSRIIEQQYTLDVLLGCTPRASKPRDADIPLLPPPQGPPAGVPALLLDRRPDLRSAELRLKAATARIGVAIADLYPDLSLSGTVGYRNDQLGGLFEGSHLFYNLLAEITLRLFEGGRLRANIDLRAAQAEELAAAYARLILNAMAEVETALSNAAFLSQRVAQLKQQLTSIRKAEALAWSNYRKGLQPLLDVLDVQRRRYLVEQSYLQAAQTAWNNRIALYLALGGDWLEKDDAP